MDLTGAERQKEADVIEASYHLVWRATQEGKGPRCPDRMISVAVDSCWKLYDKDRFGN